jgi:hypothetical protein
VRSVNVDDLPVAVGDEAAGFRLVATVSVRGQTVRVTSDFTAIRRDRAVAYLLTSGVNSPFPQAERTALVTKMAGRMDP